MGVVTCTPPFPTVHPLFSYMYIPPNVVSCRETPIERLALIRARFSARFSRESQMGYGWAKQKEFESDC